MHNDGWDGPANRYDNFNLCKNCFNKDCIDKHLAEFPEHTEFILKDKKVFPYVRPEGNELIDTIDFLPNDI